MNYDISNFWSRIGAFLIDIIFLGILGLFLGLVIGDYLVVLNKDGILIGFGISLFYFSIANSQLCNGQTLGKKFLKIKVVDEIGEYLSFQKSFIRSLIITVPYFFIKYPIKGIAEESIMNIIFYQLMFYALIGLMLIYLFNKFTRQSLHDLVIKSFVVSDKRLENGNEFSPIKSYIFYLIGGVAVVLMVSIIYDVFDQKQDKLADLKLIQKELIKIEGIINAETRRNTHKIIGDEMSVTESLIGILYVNEIPDNYVEFDNSPIVKKAGQILFEYSGINNMDLLTVELVRGYDIGIAKSNNSMKYSRSPYEWLEILEISNSEVLPNYQKEINNEKIESKELSKLQKYIVNDYHTIYYNSKMPINDIKILESAISKLKGYFPINQEIDVVFLNEVV